MPKDNKAVGKCKHGKEPYYCQYCKGKGYLFHINLIFRTCEHGRQKRKCIDCGGSSTCDHGRLKASCKECGGSSFCRHGRQKSRCKDCGGRSICEHGKRKDRCVECGGSGICYHGKNKFKCVRCKKIEWFVVDYLTIRDAPSSGPEEALLHCPGGHPRGLYSNAENLRREMTIDEWADNVAKDTQ
jgi:hypothetical protein